MARENKRERGYSYELQCRIELCVKIEMDFKQLDRVNFHCITALAKKTLKMCQGFGGMPDHYFESWRSWRLSKALAGCQITHFLDLKKRGTMTQL